MFLPGEIHGQRSLAGYSPWGHKKSDTTGRLTDTSNNFSWLFRHSSSSFLISFSICLLLEFSVSGIISWLNRGVRSQVSPSAQRRIHELSPDMVFNCHLVWINTKYVQYYYHVNVNHNLAIWYNVIGFHSCTKFAFSVNNCPCSCSFSVYLYSFISKLLSVEYFSSLREIHHTNT